MKSKVFILKSVLEPAVEKQTVEAGSSGSIGKSVFHVRRFSNVIGKLFSCLRRLSGNAGKLSFHIGRPSFYYTGQIEIAGIMNIKTLNTKILNKIDMKTYFFIPLMASVFCCAIVAQATPAIDTVPRNSKELLASHAWQFRKVEIKQAKNGEKDYSLVQTVNEADSTCKTCDYLGFAVKNIVFIGDKVNLECFSSVIFEADYQILPIDENTLMLDLAWRNNTPGDIQPDAPPVQLMYRIIIKDENTIEVIRDGSAPDNTGQIVPTNIISILKKLN
jgi:hypothetical protein